MELASPHSAFNSSLRQLNHLNALLTLLRPSYLGELGGPVWIPFSCHTDTIVSSGPPQLTNPPRFPTHMHTHLTCSAPSNGFCTSFSGRRKEGKKRRKRGHSWLWWMRLLTSSPTSDRDPGSMPTDPAFSSNSTNTMNSFSVFLFLFFFERERET